MASFTSLGQLFDTNTGAHSVTATPAVGDLIVIVAYGTVTGAQYADPTISDNNPDGLSGYTKLMSCYRAAAQPGAFVYVRNALIGNAASTVFTATPNQAGAETGGGLQVFALSGMSNVGSAACRGSGFQTNGAAAGTPTCTLKAGVMAAGATQAALTTNPLIGLVHSTLNPPAVTEPSGWTESLEAGFAAPVAGIETCFRNSGETNSTITWASTSANAYGACVVEFDASSATPTPPPPQMTSTRVLPVPTRVPTRMT